MYEETDGQISRCLSISQIYFSSTELLDRKRYLIPSRNVSGQERSNLCQNQVIDGINHNLTLWPTTR